MNYAYLRSRMIPIFSEGPLPEGRWLPISAVAAKVGKSNQTVRLWYLSGKIRGLKPKKGALLASLDDAEKVLCDQAKNVQYPQDVTRKMAFLKEIPRKSKKRKPL
jgi:hypothetical protein